MEVEFGPWCVYFVIIFHWIFVSRIKTGASYFVWILRMSCAWRDWILAFWTYVEEGRLWCLVANDKERRLWKEIKIWFSLYWRKLCDLDENFKWMKLCRTQLCVQSDYLFRQTSTRKSKESRIVCRTRTWIGWNWVVFVAFVYMSWLKELQRTAVILFFILLWCLCTISWNRISAVGLSSWRPLVHLKTPGPSCLAYWEYQPQICFCSHCLESLWC